MQVLVSDTSVIIDLERGDLIEPVFRLDYEFVVPDLLYEQELRPHGGERLLELGLGTVELDEHGVDSALRQRKQVRSLSLPDVFAYTLARLNDWVLLTGDGPLRALAERTNVECHGVLWVLDELETADLVDASRLHDALSRISGHLRCRLIRSTSRKEKFVSDYGNMRT